MILTVFVLSIFALIGQQLYSGALRKKCILSCEHALGPNITHDQFLNYTMDQTEEGKIFSMTFLTWFIAPAQVALKKFVNQG